MARSNFILRKATGEKEKKEVMKYLLLIIAASIVSCAPTSATVSPSVGAWHWCQETCTERSNNGACTSFYVSECERYAHTSEDDAIQMEEQACVDKGYSALDCEYSR